MITFIWDIYIGLSLYPHHNYLNGPETCTKPQEYFYQSSTNGKALFPCGNKAMDFLEVLFGIFMSYLNILLCKAVARLVWTTCYEGSHGNV